MVRVDLVRSTPDADDFHLPNGNFNDKRFEMLSYISGEKLLEDASPYLEPPGSLPKSETQGLGLLDVEGDCFGNLPPKPAAYVSRASLEAELQGLVSDDYHPIVTLHGMGGIGKTSLALTVLHSISETKRFSVALWFSARDIDLLQEGPRRVHPHILDVEDVAEEYARLIVPPQASEKGFKASAFLAAQLTQSEIGPTLFVFDNFETVTNPGEFFKWVETYTRSPNKVLITGRHRDFKGDYPVEVRGMTHEESDALIHRTAARLDISDLLTRAYREELVRESKGHPYAIKVLLGEIAKAGELKNIARIVASRDDILTALFERTYANLSPAATRLFLTLCHWRVNVPFLALEAVMLRPENEPVDVEEAVDELRRAAFIDQLESPKDKEIFLNVPLVAAEFGRRKLAVSSMKPAIEADTQMLQLFGPGAPSDVTRGVAPRVESLIKVVAKKIQAGSSLALYMPILEFVATRHNLAWLMIARLHEESTEPRVRNAPK